ncbi:MAG TPA: hypothetical protein VEU33_08540 [Archangium sp.]|nr:hypothetical protein [Archangium sp.]
MMKSNASRLFAVSLVALLGSAGCGAAAEEDVRMEQQVEAEAKAPGQVQAMAQYCVTLTGTAEWCGPVPGVIRYTTSTPGSYAVALNGNCGAFSGGRACQFDLYRNGVKATDSGVGKWYSVQLYSYTAGACPAAVQPIACGVRADGNITIP